MIDDGMGFPLVPWRPALEQRIRSYPTLDGYASKAAAEMVMRIIAVEIHARQG
jgi:hypothetical protein